MGLTIALIDRSGGAKLFNMQEWNGSDFQLHLSLDIKRIFPDIFLQAVAENLIWNAWCNWYQPRRTDWAKDSGKTFQCANPCDGSAAVAEEWLRVDAHSVFCPQNE